MKFLIIGGVMPLLCLARTASTLANREALVSTGLRNLGNTCYMNAQLQCAYHIPLVRQLIDKPPSGNGDAVPSVGLQALQNVFENMETASQQDLPAISPRILCQTLRIPVMEQQDSQEFWKLFLPVLKLQPLVDLYQGAYEDYICAVDGSGRERRREEPFLDLSLDLGSDSVLGSLERMFGAPELLSESEGNGWRPEKGADKVDALKGSSLRVQGLPPILQLHLKRFQYDWQTDIMSKINTRFKFPKVLDLSEICVDMKEDDGDASLCLYDLQAIVIHAGEYGSGHYYAYVRPDVTRNIWYRFNDHQVTKVSFKDVIADGYGGQSSKKKDDGILKQLFGGGSGWGGRTSSAYMLQYTKRKDTKLLYG